MIYIVERSIKISDHIHIHTHSTLISYTIIYITCMCMKNNEIYSYIIKHINILSKLINRHHGDPYFCSLSLFTPNPFHKLLFNFCQIKKKLEVDFQNWQYNSERWIIERGPKVSLSLMAGARKCLEGGGRRKIRK